MSKHRHSKDKMHMTYTEIKNQWSSKNKKKIPFEQLPFYCCSLSLAPFEDPVCTPDGQVFDILYIMPFIKKYQRSPVSGKPLKPSDLIKMFWTRSQNMNNLYEYQDPISYKIFTQTTHIVCIRQSGYVYAYDTIKQLNKKPKNYFDLVTNQPFTPADIITIQDPALDKERRLEDFDYLKNNLPFIPPEKIQPEINQTQTINRVMIELNQHKNKKKQDEEKQIQVKKKKKIELEGRQDVKGFVQWALENKIYRHQRESEAGGSSLTSTNFTPMKNSQMSFRELKGFQIRDKIYQIVVKQKKKGYAQICTNIGNLSFKIHCDLVPKTSENFMELAESNYFDNTQFHRLVKNFCLQGGDPTGAGSGGTSTFGKPFQDQFHSKLSHNKIGILSMANSGPDTNNSQFFITLAQCSILDKKHSVFGQLLDNQQLLQHINKQYTSKSQKPKYPITILNINCYQNPFRQALKKLREKHQYKSKNLEKQQRQKQKQRWIDSAQDKKFSLPYVSKQGKNKDGTLSSKLLEDYF